MGFDDPETHGQSNASAHSRGLGSEIRLEYPRAKMCRYAGPVVCNLDAAHLSERVETAGHTYPARCRLLLQGLLRVDDQVEQHLMKLIGVGEDGRNILGEVERHFDAARANSVAGDVERSRHNVVDRHRTAFGWLLPSHREEGPHDARAALGSSANLQRGGLGCRV